MTSGVSLGVCSPYSEVVGPKTYPIGYLRGEGHTGRVRNTLGLPIPTDRVSPTGSRVRVGVGPVTFNSPSRPFGYEPDGEDPRRKLEGVRRRRPI